MRIKKLSIVAAIACMVVGLSSCSSMKKHSGSGYDDSSVNGGGVETYGAGDNSGFGSGMSPAELLAKKVYYFDFDRSEIRDSEKPAILANADKLIQNPRAKILLEGHTDPRGSREYNVALAERRANSVANLMRSRGVSSDQIRVISYGAERLAVPGRNEEAYQLDRRVVLVYLQH